MSKIKRVLALLLAMAMVLGTTLTTFAAAPTPVAVVPTSTITVTGLAAIDGTSTEPTTVHMYQAVRWDANASNWVVEDWAEPYITLDTTKKAYVINDAVELGKAVPEKAFDSTTTKGTSVEFVNIPVGAYVILAASKSATYNTMVAETYDSTQTYMAAKNATVVAKTSGYVVGKAADDNFVAKGETVTFTITTTFPSFENADSADNAFSIVDTPNGLDITGIKSIAIGGTDVDVKDILAGYAGENETYAGSYVINLTSQIGTANENAGKAVVVTYDAIVTANDGYSNTVNTYRNDTKLGDDKTEGFTGNITITKYAEDGTTILNNAEFEVYEGTKTSVEADSTSAPLYFIKTGDGVYDLAKSTDTGATKTIVATNGTVQINGIDEGKYWFKETKAPEGYSVNDNGVEIEITDEEATAAVDNISKMGSLNDTKLSTLPSTGGIGTTIFTIGGCLIMITAAGLFFASRRKSAKK